MTAKKTFKAKLGSADAGSLFFEVPFDLKAAFGKSRPPVRVTLHGPAGPFSYRSTPALYGGRWYIPVRRDRREAAGVALGDVLRVTMELDAAPRVVKAPPPLAAALKKNARAKAAWAALSYSHRQEHAAAILEAKKPETRARRVAKAIELLSKG